MDEPQRVGQFLEWAKEGKRVRRKEWEPHVWIRWDKFSKCMLTQQSRPCGDPYWGNFFETDWEVVK